MSRSLDLTSKLGGKVRAFVRLALVSEYSGFFLVSRRTLGVYFSRPYASDKGICARQNGWLHFRGDLMAFMTEEAPRACRAKAPFK